VLRYRGLPLKALFRNPALGLDRPTSPSLNRSVHLSLVGTSLVLVPTSTITYLHTLRTDGSKRTLTLPAVFVTLMQRSRSVWRPTSSTVVRANHGSIGDSWPIAFSGCPRGTMRASSFAKGGSTRPSRNVSRPVQSPVQGAFPSSSYLNSIIVNARK
jgi:hypothetical protein